MRGWLSLGLAAAAVLLWAPAPARADSYNGAALTPPMGFNDWNAYGCNINEDVIRQTAAAMKANGMQEAGYRFVNIDDCWQDGRTGTGAQKPLIGRGADGHLRSDPVNFPSGMKALADYVHSQGLKFGLYSSNGTATCQNVAGTLGHETTDAQDYASWGVDYFKLDTCNSGLPSDPKAFYTRYKVFSDALLATGRQIVFSICDFTQGGQTWLWGPEIGNLWRTTGDIRATFSSMLSNFTSSQTRATYAGPGHWNDPDMLEIGTGGFSSLAAPVKPGDTTVQVESASGAIAGSAFRMGTQRGGDLESEVVSTVGTAAGAPSTIFAPAQAGDTNVKVGSVSGFTVGQPVLVDTGGTYEAPTITAVGTAGTASTLADAATASNIKLASVANVAAGDDLNVDGEAAKVASVGTAAGPATTTVAPVSAGDTNVKVASVNGFTAGDPVVVDGERATVTNVGTGAGAATTTVAPVAAGDTNVKLASVNGVVAGQPLAVGDETVTVQSVGTAAGGNTTTVAPLQPGDTNIKVASINGMTVGHQVVMYESGAQPLGTPIESATITAVGTAAGGQTTTVAPAQPGDTNLKVASINGFTVGQPLQVMLADGSRFESATVSAIGTAAGASTTLASAVPAGATTVKVTSVNGFVPGQQLAIGVGKSEELATVGSVGTAGADGTGVTLTAPLAKEHLILAIIRGLGTGIDLTAPLTAAHPSGSSARGQGTGITVTPLTAAHPLATYGANPGQGINIRDAGTGVTVSPLARAHDLGAAARGTGTGVDVTALSAAHPLGSAARDTGTGVTLTAPLNTAHPSGAAVRDESKPGTGITFSPALTSAHPVSAVVRGGGTGIALATPATVAHPAGTSIGKSGMSLEESRTHFSLWAMAAAPLLAGTDVADMAKENLAIYLNQDVIAIDQDPLGVQASTVSNLNGQWRLARPLANGDRGVALFNAGNADWMNASADAASVGLDPATAYIAKDLWSKQVTKVLGSIDVADLAPHATAIYRVSDRPPTITLPQHVTAQSPGPNGVAVAYTATGADALDGPLTPACSRPSGALFPIGPTTVTCMVTDAAGRTASGSFVVDVAPPAIPGTVTGTVPATLALTLGSPAAFNPFTAGVTRDYTATTTADVISTAGDAALSVTDPSTTAPGHLVNGTYWLPSALQAAATSPAGTGGSPKDVPATVLTYAGPVTHDPVALTFTQHIGQTDALRTGTYSKTLTFTLSTTNP